jgi:hypothetical protein
MNLLGREYSGGIERLWNEFDPKPEVFEYSPKDLCGKDPRFSGDHRYIYGVGDEIRIAPQAHDYTLAHELMHAVLRRKQYPHMTFRAMGWNTKTVCEIVSQLDSAMLHPLINLTLKQLYGIALPEEHTDGYIRRCVYQLNEGRRGQTTGHHSVLWALIFLEMVMWDEGTLDYLRGTLKLPEAWELTEELLSISTNLAYASPVQCRAFAIDALRLIDEYLHRNYTGEPNLYFERVMFPPPPFLSDPDSPAKSYFVVGKRPHRDGTRELEVRTLADNVLCWVEAINSSNTDQIVQVVSAFDTSSTRDFTDCCERLIGTVIADEC